MWREFTRENPARRGWALGLSVVVFAATMALAWGLTTGRISTSRAGSPVDFDGWPIRFSMPAAYELRDVRSIAPEGDARGPGGVARFDANDREGQRSLTISYYQWPAGLSWPELRNRLRVRSAARVTDVPWGKWDWRIFESEPLFTETNDITVVHDEPDGLVIVINTTQRADDTQTLSDLMSLCRSVKLN